MELLQLKYFMEVARCEHVTRAAQELHIAQPTLSQVIKRLEGELGVRLFEHEGRGIRLTEAGRRVFAHAQAIFGEIDRMQLEISRTEHPEKNIVRVRLYNGHVTFADIFKRFNERCPYAEFMVQTAEKSYAQERGSTAARENICVVASTPDAQFPNALYLFDEEICLVVSKKNVLAAGDTVQLSELKNMEIIADPHMFLKDIISVYCKRAGFTLKFTFVAESNAMLASMVGLDYGVAFWPKRQLPEILSPELKALRLVRPFCMRSYYLIQPIDRQLTDMEHRFLDFAREYCGQFHI